MWGESIQFRNSCTLCCLTRKQSVSLAGNLAEDNLPVVGSAPGDWSPEGPGSEDLVVQVKHNNIPCVS